MLILWPKERHPLCCGDRGQKKIVLDGFSFLFSDRGEISVIERACLPGSLFVSISSATSVFPSFFYSR